MHNGYINVDNKKMSKSAGNFFTVRDIAEGVRPGGRCAMFMLSAHYRSPLNFSQELIEQSKSALDRLYTAQANYEFLLEKGGTVDREPNEAEQKFIDAIPAIRERFIACMDDDMNTAGALGAIFDLVKEGNIVAVSGASTKAVKAALEALNELTGVLGLLYHKKNETQDDVEALVQQRQEARKARSWKEAARHPRPDHLHGIHSGGYAPGRKGAQGVKNPDAESPCSKAARACASGRGARGAGRPEAPPPPAPRVHFCALRKNAHGGRPPTANGICNLRLKGCRKCTQRIVRPELSFHIGGLTQKSRLLRPDFLRKAVLFDQVKDFRKRIDSAAVFAAILHPVAEGGKGVAVGKGDHGWIDGIQRQAENRGIVIPACQKGAFPDDEVMRGRALRLAARLKKENPHFGFQRAAAGQIVRTSLRCKTGQGSLYRLRFRFGQRCQAAEQPPRRVRSNGKAKARRCA